MLFGVIGLGGKTARKKREKMNETKALEGLQIDKENFESYFGDDFNLPVEIWQQIVAEINEEVCFVLDDILAGLVADIKDGKYGQFTFND